MIQKIYVLILATILSILPLEVFANTSDFTYTVVLQKKYKESNDAISNRDQKRKPSQPMQCTISTSSITSDISKEDITSYEIWDDSERCIGIYFSDTDCVQSLYRLTGNYQIRIYTLEYIYDGWVYLD